MNMRNKHDRDPEWDKVNYPTQDDIISYNQEENRKKEWKEISTLLKLEGEDIRVKKSFLEKLKDFDYWKEWKNQ
tara:strand:- start:832 stop:1053 length:222 start_codon:yes stop_codon:yes gene_type:complete